MDVAVNKIQFFHEATIRICGSLDIKKALWRLFQYIEDFIPMTGIGLYMFESGANTLRYIAHATPYKNERLNQAVPIPEEVKGELQRGWLETEAVMIFNRPESDPVIRTMSPLLGKSDRSALVMKLGIEGKTIGTLVLYADGKDQYNSEHAGLLSIIHDPIAIAMSNAVKHQKVLKLKDMLKDDNVFLQQELMRVSGDEIIGKDKGLKDVMDLVKKVSSLDSPVLLLGETGVGKEIIANAIHYSSPRRNGPYIKVNCGAIPESLIDSELFGHEKGAFTGAIAQKRGRFERAHQGTIFLDEIGDLPLQAQTRLLRVLQSKQIERVGGTEYIEVDIRIIAATHRDLRQMVSSGQFRQDLWFRLNVFPIVIPHLRERKEDIPTLVHYFIERKAKELKFQEVPQVGTNDLERLNEYHWPGNVRELENVVERALIQKRGQEKDGLLTIEPFLLKPKGHNRSMSSDPGYGLPTLEEGISNQIKSALALSNGKIHGPGGAAELLGINPHTLRSKMYKLGIRVKKTLKLDYLSP
jgi:transcriptional regulator with GAF, ATPase, and Fis domain